MQFKELTNARISIRDFQEKPVDKDLLTEIVSDAQQAPSWANSQPWKVYIATGETMKSIQKEHLIKSQEGIKGYADLPVKSIKEWGDLPWSNMEAWLDKVHEDATMTEFSEANARLWNTPSMAYITIPKTAPVWSIYDSGSFAQTLMLSAASHGVDTMVAYENIKYPDEIRSHLGVSDDEIVVAGIALGYRSQHPINQFENSRVETNRILTIK
ncbi:Oxygen-insensitive NAD(P)H nitroreductase [Streptococcus gordonii]|uniref:Oxygen-insensitive NAD(P)H nitroreductase n=1 Tax=Streptococcus gordonii TaxID=1302 RepID=A0A139MXK0_STRGN|nr:Oxygen-insensitive NAD(P)H nitroreductase [Streptococcus gordonii]